MRWIQKATFSSWNTDSRAIPQLRQVLCEVVTFFGSVHSQDFELHNLSLVYEAYLCINMPYESGQCTDIDDDNTF